MANFPDGHEFAFTVFDDTDNATVANVEAVYSLLHECGMRTTKSVWVFPPRGRFQGECLLNTEYLEFTRKLVDQGFEIALHGVGDGYFTRQEILEGLTLFRDLLGSYPRSYANHADNPYNLFWWDRRFEWPVSWLYLLASRRRPPGGADPHQPYFWADYALEHIDYIRNLTFKGINTLDFDPRMPYRIDRTASAANMWFSSSDGHTVEEFTDLISPTHVEYLAASGGACIVYTHFASGFVKDGKVEPQFEERIRHLASLGGWFVPVTELLDHLAKATPTDDPGYRYRLGRNFVWLANRIEKRLRYRR